MKITSWNVDLRVVQSAELLDWCLREHGVDRMLVAMRLRKNRGRWIADAPKACARFERLFAPYILERFLASGWPGNEMLRHPGLLYLQEFGPRVKELLLNVEPDLNKWHMDEGALPEDICLFRRGDPHPIFVSVIHEGDAWLLTNRKPNFRGISLDKVIESADLRKELLAFPGKYFCRPWRGKLRTVDRRLGKITM